MLYLKLTFYVEIWYNVGAVDTQIHSRGVRAERSRPVDFEREEFIRLVKLHPELCSALRQILTGQEPPHEKQAEQNHKD